MRLSKRQHFVITWWSHVLASQVLAMAIALIWYLAPPVSAPPLTLTGVLLLIFLSPAWSPLFFLVLPVYTVARGHHTSVYVPAGLAGYVLVFAVYFRHRKNIIERSN